MRLDHVAIWTRDLERLREFYEWYFGAVAGERYASARQPGFTSYLLRFPGSEARLELMARPHLAAGADGPALGYAHVAIGVGSRTTVDALAARMSSDGIELVSAPRETGDGYYEAVVRDPDGNLVEITT